MGGMEWDVTEQDGAGSTGMHHLISSSVLSSASFVSSAASSVLLSPGLSSAVYLSEKGSSSEWIEIRIVSAVETDLGSGCITVSAISACSLLSSVNLRLWEEVARGQVRVTAPKRYSSKGAACPNIRLLLQAFHKGNTHAILA